MTDLTCKCHLSKPEIYPICNREVPIIGIKLFRASNAPAISCKRIDPSATFSHFLTYTARNFDLAAPQTRYAMFLRRRTGADGTSQGNVGAFWILNYLRKMKLNGPEEDFVHSRELPLRKEAKCLYDILVLANEFSMKDYPSPPKSLNIGF